MVCIHTNDDVLTADDSSEEVFKVVVLFTYQFTKEINTINK